MIPVYNRADLLSRALNSVVNQSLRPSEIVIVDDGSTDSTWRVASQIALRHDLVRAFRIVHSGAAVARNFGLAQLSTRYVAFQDSDDEWDLRFLELLYAEMSRGQRNVVFSSHTVYFEDGTSELRPRSVQSNVKRSLAWQNQFSTQAALLDRSSLGALVKFDERLPRLQDWDLWLNVSRIANFGHVPLSLVDLYRQADSLTSNEKAYDVAIRLVLNKHRGFFCLHPVAFARHMARSLIRGLRGF